MIVKWLGHSCFLLKGDHGLLILLDPFFEDEVGYSLPLMETNIVIISHDHLDHNNVDAAGSNPDVIFEVLERMHEAGKPLLTIGVIRLAAGI